MGLGSRWDHPVGLATPRAALACGAAGCCAEHWAPAHAALGPGARAHPQRWRPHPQDPGTDWAARSCSWLRRRRARRARRPAPARSGTRGRWRGWSSTCRCTPGGTSARRAACGPPRRPRIRTGTRCSWAARRRPQWRSPGRLEQQGPRPVQWTPQLMRGRRCRCHCQAAGRQWHPVVSKRQRPRENWARAAAQRRLLHRLWQAGRCRCPLQLALCPFQSPAPATATTADPPWVQQQGCLGPGAPPLLLLHCWPWLCLRLHELRLPASSPAR